MSILTHTVKFNKEVTFIDHTGVSFVNTTTPETASLVTSATVSPADVIEYSVTWLQDPVIGDVIEWRYDADAVGANYKDTQPSATEAVFKDTFSDGVSQALTAPAHTSLIEIDKSGSGWAGQNTIVTDGSGNATGTVNGSTVYCDVTENTYIAKIRLFVSVDNIQNITYLHLRRVVPTSNANQINIQINREANNTQTMRFVERLASVSQPPLHITSFSASLVSDFVDFTIEDNGTDITVTCESGESMTINDSEMTLAPANTFCLNVGSESINTFFDIVGIDAIQYELMPDQELILTNCLNQRKPVSAEPWLFLTRNGAQQSLLSSEWIWEVGVQYNDILYMVARNPGGDRHCFKYEGGAITQQTSAAISTGLNCRMLFADSNGNLYTSFLDPAGTVGLYWSVDGGINWVLHADVVLELPDNDISTYIQTMDESDTGTLIIGAYSNDPNREGRGAWRSVDDGVSWTYITPSLDFGVGSQREHVHNVSWDRYRQAWMITTGDKGANAIINYSKDDGVTWNSWIGSGQVIAMAFDVTGMYFTAEINDDSSIYKATELGGSFTKVKTLSTTINGWARFGWEDTESGYVAFIYSGTGKTSTMWTTKDSGATWVDLLDGVPVTLNWGKLYSKCSDYANKRGSNNFNYQGGLMFKIYPSDYYIEVDNTSGVDYQLNANGIWNEIPDYGGLVAGCNIRLLSDYAEPYQLNPAINYDLNGFNFTYATPAVLTIDEDFEVFNGTVTLQAQNTDPIIDSIEEAFSPPQSAKFLNDGSFTSLINNTCYTGSVAGDDAFLKGYYYYNESVLPTSDITIMEIRNCLQVKLRTEGEISVLINGATRNLRQLVGPRYELPFQGWNKLKVQCRFSSGAGAQDGFVRVWQNDTPIIVANGLDTDGAWDRGAFSQNSAGTEVCFWDNIKASKTDTDY